MTRLLLEWRAIWKIAGPLLVSQLCYTGMGFVDALVAGRAEVTDLAGVAVGGGLWLPMALFLTGLAYATTPLVAKATGQNNLDKTQSWIGQAITLMLAVGVLAAVLVASIAEPALTWFGADSGTRSAGVDYLMGIAIGIPGFCLYQALRSSLIGLGQTKLEMIIALSMVGLNFPLSAALVFGWGPLTPLGSFGIGLGTSILFWAGCGALWIGLSKGYANAKPRANQLKPQRRLLGEFYALGWPIAVAICVEASVFSVIALLLAPLGAVQVGAHQIALNLSALFFMLPLGIGLATTSRVGYLRGLGDLSGALYSSKAAIWLGLAIAGTTCLLTFGFRDAFALLYGANPEVTQLAAALMIYAAIYQLPDSVQVIGAGALRGWEDSRGPLWVALICYWVICLPGGLWLGRGALGGPGWGPKGFWIFLIVGLTLASIGMLWRLRQLTRRVSLDSAPASPH